ncbi:GDYXXLXY domain-containing protein [Desulfitobacterium sp.]|uniref:GDYXXLXY domain-containing protein n=1 Tax=Desulfitobacterium sp. TaxID=49981 RepID=UPI002B21ACA2|nr:GDYXXLXY domain-containing protein [Desulfitobacterium sp.]MEA4901346.1 GDYXXLXY domain-containing protein [Desulfitobacterium sp.]
MKKNVKLLIFLGMVILQLAVPVFMIQDHQATLNQGQQFKFKAAPVDPYDAFMGRYLNISIEEQRKAVEDSSIYQPGKTVYAVLENDAQGYAHISGLSFNRPPNQAYFKTKIAYTEGSNSPSGNVILQIPFNRYYMPENQAIEAEKVLNTRFINRIDDVYITVRIHNGKAVMERVYIGGKTIEDYLEENRGLAERK